MIIFEIDDFDYWSDNSVVDGDSATIFSPMFIFIIDWAYKNNHLDISLSNESTFNNAYKDIVDKKCNFKSFLLNTLDSKLLDTYFTINIRKFICDYKIRVREQLMLIYLRLYSDIYH